jgi:hypothetical protein
LSSASAPGRCVTLWLAASCAPFNRRVFGASISIARTLIAASKRGNREPPWGQNGDNRTVSRGEKCRPCDVQLHWQPRHRWKPGLWDSCAEAFNAPWFRHYQERKCMRLGTAIKCVVVALASLGVACGGGAPTAPTPTIAQIAGNWSYASRVASVVGTDCSASTIRSFLMGGGITPATGQLQITQAAGAITATSLTAPDLFSAPASCTHQGTVDAQTMDLRAQFCSIAAFGLHGRLRPVSNFGGGGCNRELRVQSLVIRTTVASGGMTGTITETWQVFNTAGTQIDQMTFNSDFNATRTP